MTSQPSVEFVGDLETDFCMDVSRVTLLVGRDPEEISNYLPSLLDLFKKLAVQQKMHLANQVQLVYFLKYENYQYTAISTSDWTVICTKLKCDKIVENILRFAKQNNIAVDSNLKPFYYFSGNLVPVCEYLFDEQHNIYTKLIDTIPRSLLLK